MKKLPKIKTKPVSEKRKERLLRWFSMRKAEKQLEALDSAIEEKYDASVRIPEGKNLVRHFDNSVEIGQIRLMDPTCVPDLNRPLYYAVLRRWDDDYMLIAPFSTFSEPATTGELLTGIKNFALAVLQVWNARTVPLHFLERGWLVSKLDESVSKDALSVFAHICGGKSISDELREKIGFPIIHPDDPRIEYQSEERAILGNLEAMISKYEEAIDLSLSTKQVPSLLKFIRELNLAAAAEDEKPVLTKGFVLPRELISAEGEALNIFLKDRKHIESFNDAVCSNFVPGSQISNLIWKFRQTSHGKLKDGMSFIVMTAAKCEKIALGIVHEYEGCLFAKITRILNDQEPSIESTDEIFMIVFE